MQLPGHLHFIPQELFHDTYSYIIPIHYSVGTSTYFPFRVPLFETNYNTDEDRLRIRTSYFVYPLEVNDRPLVSAPNQRVASGNWGQSMQDAFAAFGPLPLRKLTLGPV